MNIAGIIEYLYPLADNLVNFELQDKGDDNGITISKWTLVDEEPTIAYLESKEADYLADVAAKAAARKARKIAIATKLGVSTTEEFQALDELLKDKNLD